MKRIIMLVVVALVMAAMMVVMTAAAMAVPGEPPIISKCPKGTHPVQGDKQNCVQNGKPIQLG
jgi:hypothetical protein